MTTAKEQFLRNKTMCDQWTAVCKTDWYATVLVHAMSDLLEGRNLTSEQQQGANLLKEVLFSIGDAEPERELSKGPKLQRMDSGTLRNRPNRKN